MQKNLTPNINHLMDDNHTQLGQFAKKVTELRKINQFLQTLLPEQLKNHCHVANLRNRCLVIAADNANWLTYLRFHTAEILAKLQQHSAFSQITDIRCITVTNLTSDGDNKPKFQPHLSSNSAESIKATAMGITDEELRQALLKLAKNAG